MLENLRQKHVEKILKFWSIYKKDSNDKYMVLVTNGLGSKGTTDTGRVKYTKADITVLSQKLRDQNIRVIPVAITQKCSASEKNDVSNVSYLIRFFLFYIFFSRCAQSWSFCKNGFFRMIDFELSSPFRLLPMLKPIATSPTLSMKSLLPR